MVVYLDSVFVLNAVMDYVLCLVTGRLAGIRLCRWRYLAAGLVGGLYSVAVFLPGCAFLSEIPVKLAAGVLMSLIAYGGEDHLARLILLLLAISCAMAGCVLLLGFAAGNGEMVMRGIFYTDVDGRTLLIAATSVYLVITLVFKTAAKHGTRGELLEIRVSLNGRTASMTALQDSGNDLRNPMDGRPILVVAPGVLDGVLPSEVRSKITSKRLEAPVELLEPLMEAAPELKPQLLPYRAVGTSGGLLLTIRTEWVEIYGTRHSGILAALSPTVLGNGYTALWGGEVRKV